jgi:hypothetical protein
MHPYHMAGHTQEVGLAEQAPALMVIVDRTRAARMPEIDKERDTGSSAIQLVNVQGAAGATAGPNGVSLHGESAAKRQAITELLFFASVGDLRRCKKIIAAWNLQVRDPHGPRRLGGLMSAPEMPPLDSVTCRSTTPRLLTMTRGRRCENEGGGGGPSIRAGNLPLCKNACMRAADPTHTLCNCIPLPTQTPGSRRGLLQFGHLAAGAACAGQPHRPLQPHTPRGATPCRCRHPLFPPLPPPKLEQNKLTQAVSRAPSFPYTDTHTHTLSLSLSLSHTHTHPAAAPQEAVRGDHGEVAQLLMENGGKVVHRSTKELVDLSESPLAGNVRLFQGYDPDWEIDPSSLTLLEKIGGCGAALLVERAIGGEGSCVWGGGVGLVLHGFQGQRIRGVMGSGLEGSHPLVIFVPLCSLSFHCAQARASLVWCTRHGGWAPLWLSRFSSTCRSPPWETLRLSSMCCKRCTTHTR